MRVSLLCAVAAGAFCLPAAALAGETGADAGAGADAGEPILVIGHADGYIASQSVTATKTDTPLLDIPQTITVVTRQQLEDQAHHSMADVLRYVPGTTVGQGEGNRDQITLRGQNTTADFFLDGVRDDVQYFRNLYNIERVEVLKGPYALIFGRGGGGGIVNRAQKTPSADRIAAAAAGSVNSFGGWDLSGDVNVPLSDAAAVRVNAFYEKLESFRDFVDGERYAVNPYVAVKLGDNWRMGLSYEYVKDDRVTDRGVPSVKCATGCTPAPLTGHDTTFFGVPGVNRAGLEAHIAKVRLDGDLASGLTWSNTVLYGDYDKYYTNVFANGPLDPADNTVALSSYTDPTTRQNFIAQSNLAWDVAFAGTTHKVLLGLEYARQTSANRRYNGVLSSSTFDLDLMAYPTVSFPTLARETHSRVSAFSAYAQDQIGIGQHVDLVVGVRFDRFEIKGVDVVAANPFDRVDEKVSPRFGLIIKPQPNISLYGSYSQSFLPRSGDQFLTLTAAQENLAPEKFTNWEVGGKWDIRPGLSATLALFQLERTNATTPDPANPLATINAGTTRTRGVELALTGRILPGWQVSGGYSYQKAALKANEAVRLAQVPEHQFSLWNRYDFNRSVGAGLGVIHQSSQFAAIRTAPSVTRLPAFTRVDAALFLTASERVQIQLNVENVLNTRYFSDAHNNNNITPGAPINARLTARVKF